MVYICRSLPPPYYIDKGMIAIHHRIVNARAANSYHKAE